MSEKVTESVSETLPAPDMRDVFNTSAFDESLLVSLLEIRFHALFETFRSTTEFLDSSLASLGEDIASSSFKDMQAAICKAVFTFMESHKDLLDKFFLNQFGNIPDRVGQNMVYRVDFFKKVYALIKDSSSLKDPVRRLVKMVFMSEPTASEKCSLRTMSGGGSDPSTGTPVDSYYIGRNALKIYETYLKKSSKARSYHDFLFSLTEGDKDAQNYLRWLIVMNVMRNLRPDARFGPSVTELVETFGRKVSAALFDFKKRFSK